METKMKFRDTNAWYHIVLAFDTTLSSTTDMIKIWINNKSIEFNNAESLFIFMSKFSQFPKSTEKMLELRLKNTPIDKDKTHSKIISSLFNLTYEKEKIL